ncbi:tetratricopeptide repeat protein [Pollutibacter soli]|uniref:tetratricopeptide repeat protein n=1 Tax=Pollutibacter soli TaxID=3034157 RepID=UPI00301372CA
MKKFFLLLAMITGAFTSFSQQGQQLIDSLIKQLPQSKDDSAKVMMLNDISLGYYSINPDEGLKYGNQALQLAQKIKWKRGEAFANKVIAGNYGFGKSDYAKALEYALRSWEQFRAIGDKIGEAKILGDIGVVYWFQSDYPNALKYYFDALRINEELDIKNEIAATLNNIGLVYYSQEDLNKALEYILRANKIDEELGNKAGVASNLGNIGELYMNLSDTAKALEYDLKALQLNEELGDKNGIARTLGNLGAVYASKKEFPKALDYYRESLAMNEDIGNKMGVGRVLGNIGGTYLKMANDSIIMSNPRISGDLPRKKSILLQQANDYTSRGIIILKEIGDLNNLFRSYERLSEIQEQENNYKGALESYRNFTLIKDSVYSMEKDKKLTETAMRYDFDKKEAATKAEQEKKDIHQRNIRNSIVAGAVVLLLLLIVFIERYRSKQKTNKELAAAYENLKATQQQLIQSEKMAAFGVMATRMAHEIQNPLNFVNNFSDVSKHLLEEIEHPHSEEEKKEAIHTLAINLEKIHHHGTRASRIIYQLQEHARAGTAQEFFEEDSN